MRTNTNNIYTINCNYCNDSKKAVITNHLDLNGFKLQHNSLLHAVIQSFPDPIFLPDYTLFKQVLNTLLYEDSRAAKLLSLSLNKLEIVDIKTLFILTEDHIQKELVDTGNYKSGTRPSMTFRRVLKYLQTPLGDGATIHDVKFSTKFKEPPSSRNLISESVDVGCNDPEHVAPISLLRANNSSVLTDKALDHLKSRSKRIEDACYDVINKYKMARSHLKGLERTKLPNNLENALEDTTLTGTSTRSALLELSESELLHFYVRFFTKHNLFDYSEFDKWYQSIDTLPSASQLCEHKYFKSLGLISNSDKKNYSYKDAVISLILSRKILPSLPILCIRHLFQLQFKWNMATCNSITRHMITYTHDGAHIKGIKHKTSQEFSSHISQNALKENAFFEAIQLLTDNSEYITQYWAFESDSIFIAISLFSNFPVAYRFKYIQINQRFITLYKLPYFTAEQLRDQVLNTHYLETQDIHSVQAVAGWDSLATASCYLNQKIIKTLSQANINDFMKQLESSIIWSIKGEKGIREIGLDAENINKKLLFPINTTQNSSISIADKWLNDNKTPIVINNDRMNHTLRQSQFYKNNWLRLFTENEDNFIATHLPRILLCIALEKVIRNSEHFDTYIEMENMLYG